MNILFNLFIHSLLTISLIHTGTNTTCEPESSQDEKCTPTLFQGKIMRSTDMGNTWESIGEGLPVKLEIRAARIFHQEMFIGSSITQLYSKRMDQQGKWSHFDVPYFDPFNPGIQNEGIVDFYETKNGVYTSITEGWFYKRPLGSGIWIAIKAPQQKLLIYDILEDETGTLFLACLEGIFFSSDQGKTWSRSVFDGHAYEMELRGGKMFVTGENGIFRSEDKGRSWTKIITPNNAMAFTNPDADRYYHFQQSGNSMLVRRQQTSENFGFPGKLLVSTDEGKTWKVHPADNYLKDVHAVSAIISDDKGTIYCSSPSGVVRSTDNGRTWTEIIRYSGEKSMTLFIELQGGILYCSEVAAGC